MSFWCGVVSASCNELLTLEEFLSVRLSLLWFLHWAPSASTRPCGPAPCTWCSQQWLDSGSFALCPKENILFHLNMTGIRKLKYISREKLNLYCLETINLHTLLRSWNWAAVFWLSWETPALPLCYNQACTAALSLEVICPKPIAVFLMTLKALAYIQLYCSLKYAGKRTFAQESLIRLWTITALTPPVFVLDFLVLYIKNSFCSAQVVCVGWSLVGFDLDSYTSSFVHVNSESWEGILWAQVTPTHSYGRLKVLVLTESLTFCQPCSVVRRGEGLFVGSFKRIYGEQY